MSTMSTTYGRSDGSAPRQATISASLDVMNPALLKGSRRHKYGVYPETPTNGAYSILSGDILLAPVEPTNRDDDFGYGGESIKVFSSFAGQKQPDPGKIDDFCQNFMVAGMCKTNLTNPADANMAANEGAPRINSGIVAAYIDGGWGTEYTNRYPVKFGDLLVWEPPTPHYTNAMSDGDVRLMTGENSNVVSNRKERLVAKIRPLDWTAYSNYYNKIGVYLLDYSADNRLELSDLLEGGRFGVYRQNREAKLQVALNTKRKSMVDAACAIKILQDRGYLEIITPAESKKRAALKALYHTVKSALSRPELVPYDQGGHQNAATAYDTAPDAANVESLLVVDVQKAFESFNSVMDEIKDGSEYEVMQEEDAVTFSNRKFSKYHESVTSTDYYESHPRNGEHFSAYRLGEKEYEMNFDLPAISEMKTQNDVSFNWLTGVLGLGSNSNLQEHKHVTHDVLTMIENRTLAPSDTDIYTMSYKTYVNGLQTGDLDELSFLQHVKNSPVGMWTSWEMLKKAIECRIIGRASSVASGSPTNRTYNEQRLDFTMGPHYI